MKENRIDTAIFDNCTFSHFQGAGRPCASHITGTVIELSGDIGPAMPWLKQNMANCGYNQKARIISFRKNNMGVVIQPRKITVYNTEEEGAALKVVDFLKGIMTARGKITGEVKAT